MNSKQCDGYVQNLYADLDKNPLNPKLVDFPEAYNICIGGQRPIEPPNEEPGSRRWSFSPQAFELFKLLGCMKHVNNEQAKSHNNYTTYNSHSFSVWANCKNALNRKHQMH